MVSSRIWAMGAALAAVTGSVAAPAAAQPITGVYVGAGAGANFRMLSTSTSGGSQIATEWGPMGLVAVGWGYGNGFRAEVEGAYRSNEVRRFTTRRINGALIDTANPSGRVGQASAMLNVLYDFDLPRLGIRLPVPMRPYVGVGVGYSWRQLDDVSGVSPALLPSGAVVPAVDRRTGTYGAFAWQVIGGLAFPIAAVPGLEVTAEYRYFESLDAKAQTRTDILAPTGTIVQRGRTEYAAANHAALIGVRYAFNTPRPAPVAAVAPVPQAAPVARTYLVFFDWDRADLTDRARQIIADAAQNARNTRSTRIEVSGHADRSGTPQYNQRLSQRRAEAVAAELVRQGVARNEIGVQAFGESRPLVPTADNVREPQNRRVEIVLR